LDRHGFAPDGPKTRVGFPWISLDSLVRIETFQWVTADFWQKKIARALLPLGRRRRGRSGIHTMQKCSMAHRASLAHFLHFCNQLLATEIDDSLLSPDGALSRIISDYQRHFTQCYRRATLCHPGRVATPMTESIVYNITFGHLGAADAGRAADSLRRTLQEIDPAITANVSRTDKEAMDFGASLTILLTAPSIVALAKGISDWLARTHDSKVTVKGLDGEVIVENVSARDAISLAEKLQAARGKR
jgi:hypothetical protein